MEIQDLVDVIRLISNGLFLARSTIDFFKRKGDRPQKRRKRL